VGLTEAGGRRRQGRSVAGGQIPTDRVEPHLANAVQLALDALAVDAHVDELLHHGLHEGLGPADVVLGPAVAEVQQRGRNLGQVDAAIVVVGDALDVAPGEHRLEDGRVEIRAAALEDGQAGVEGHVLAAAVDPRDVPRGLLLGDGVQNRHEGAHAAARRDEDDRHAAGDGGVEEEVARGVAALDLVARLDAVDEDVGEHARVVIGRLWLCPLHRDAVVVAAAWRVRHGVLSRLVVADLGHKQPDADVLARQELGELHAVLGHQVEAEEVVGLADLAVQLELAPRRPLVPFKVLVDDPLPADHHVREDLVGLEPGRLALGGQGRAHDLLKGLDQQAAENFIVLGFYPQRAVLVADALELRDELGDVVYACGEAQYDDGQGPRQAAVLEVDDIEGVVELGVPLDEGAVDNVRDGLAVFLEERYGPLDQLGLLICQCHDFRIC
jgi:hypothetical protein